MKVSFGIKHLKSPLLILLFGFVLSTLTGLFERFMGSRLKKRQSDDIGIFETLGNQAENYILTYFKDNRISFGYDQINELKELIAESSRIIQKEDKMKVDEIEK